MAEGGDRRGPERVAGKRRRGELPCRAQFAAYTADEAEFLRAMDDYKRRERRPFPTWVEVLRVLTALGYRKVRDPVDFLEGG